MAPSPAPGSRAELDAFAGVQQGLRRSLDTGRTRTTVVVPSLSLPPEQLAQIPGVGSFEERLLCLLDYLRSPGMRMVYVTSTPLDPVLVDYHLDLVAPGEVAELRSRLVLVDCDSDPHDSATALTRTLLQKPSRVHAIRLAAGDPTAAHLEFFTTSPTERSLAVRLGLPMLACDPALLDLGHKSGCRELFRAVGVPMPDGVERVHTLRDVLDGLVELRERDPRLRRAVLKLDDSFDGVGNAVVELPDPGRLDSAAAERALRTARLGTPDADLASYLGSLEEMGGIVEAFVEGTDKRSPSVQGAIDPDGVRLVATHEQTLSGQLGQMFTGCAFPALTAYRERLHEIGRAVGRGLADAGVTGPFAVDVICRRRPRGWDVFALEVNLRHGGTTAPMHLLRALTGAEYDVSRGESLDRFGRPLAYRASDRVHDPSFPALDPAGAIGALHDAGLHHDGGSGHGSALYMLGALAEYGRLGMMSVAGSPSAATKLFDRTHAALSAAAAARTPAGAPKPRRPSGQQRRRTPSAAHSHSG